MSEPTSRESAKAIIELALILPFILLTVFASSDASHSLRIYQFLSSTAREVSVDAYRSCSDAADGATMNTCLQQAADRVHDYLEGSDGVLPGVALVVKLYRVRYNGANPLSPTLAGQYRSANALSSHYTASDIAALHSYLPGKGAIVTVEVFYQKQGWTSYFSRTHYETCIL